MKKFTKMSILNYFNFTIFYPNSRLESFLKLMSPFILSIHIIATIIKQVNSVKRFNTVRSELKLLKTGRKDYFFDSCPICVKSLY